MDENEQALYRERAELYDLIYHWKRYPEEATRLCGILDDLGVPPGASLLEAACGTGTYLQHLRGRYRVSGFDLNPGILEVARRKLPGVPLFAADMRELAIEEPVDAILCMFSSIAYVHPEPELRRAAVRFAEAVRPGGALVVEPWVPPSGFEDGHPSLQTYEDDDVKLVRAVVSRREGDLSVFRFHWLAVRRGAEDVEHFTERHVLWLCPVETLLAAFTDAGFDCRYEPEGFMPRRGLLLGRRR